MSIRENLYSFDAFLDERRRIDYYASDDFLQAVVRRFAGDAFPAVDAAVRELSARASTRWRDLADAAATPDRRPYLVQWDAHHHRVDRVCRPAETEAMEREVFGEGLFSSRTDLVTRLAKLFVIYQNGEACIACPLVCTEGMVAVLERFADRPETVAILEHVKEGRDGRSAVGAQFLTEIQGGSDVPANVVEAVGDGGAWRLHGTKFFCSVAHADYAMVTARPRGSSDVALFVMPMWEPGREGDRRNGLTIDRLKWKMGTSELPTAEITLDGAIAWPVGPLDRGLANVVGIVLTLSRLTVGLASAAFMTRAVRETVAYARFRDVFGRRIDEFPMAQAQLEDTTRAARRTTAAAFKVYRLFRESGGLSGAPDTGFEARRRRLEARELVMLQKVVSSEDSTSVVREAIAIFGGQGAVEDFSCLPRLFRDSMVNELWEGPRNVLLTQVHRDLRKAADWCPPRSFVEGILAGADPATVARLSIEFAELLSLPSLATRDAATVAACRRWDAACRDLVHAYQDAALREMG
ncbi:MAG: acyl-CoA dehydrogenase family protein [Deltaproteobacteria bacterium]|nr:acyl-CoA dehydrogenase family protein [Deltaproteobacteria bacterium]